MKKTLALKKVAALALAALMLVGTAVPASAELQLLLLHIQAILMA